MTDLLPTDAPVAWMHKCKHGIQYFTTQEQAKAKFFGKPCGEIIPLYTRQPIAVEPIEGLDDAIKYFTHDGHDKETPYAVTWDEKMSLMLKVARMVAAITKQKEG